MRNTTNIVIVGFIVTKVLLIKSSLNPNNQTPAVQRDRFTQSSLCVFIGTGFNSGIKQQSNFSCTVIIARCFRLSMGTNCVTKIK